MKSFTICTPYQIGLDEIREDEIGRACGRLGLKKTHAEFWWKNLRKRGNFET